MCLQSVDEEKYKRLGMKSVFLKHKLMELEKKYDSSQDLTIYTHHLSFIYWWVSF